MTSRKILYLYHSGSGSTRTVSEQIKVKLAEISQVHFQSMNRFTDFADIQKYDVLFFAFPTYHCQPSRSALEFIEKLPTVPQNHRAYVLTTCGLFRGNSIQIFAKQLQKRNVITVGHSTIRGPASDGALMSPIKFKIMYRYENSIAAKISQIISDIEMILKDDRKKIKMPFPSWYAPLNAPNKYLGKLTSNYLKRRIHIVASACINCAHCIKECERGCYATGEERPLMNHINCEFCLKCMHHCPQKAITFNRTQNHKRRLDYQFYHKALLKQIQKDSTTSSEHTKTRAK